MATIPPHPCLAKGQLGLLLKRSAKKQAPEWYPVFTSEKKILILIQNCLGFLGMTHRSLKGEEYRTLECNQKGFPGLWRAEPWPLRLVFRGSPTFAECSVKPCSPCMWLPERFPHHMLSGLLVHHPQGQGWSQHSTCLVFALWNCSLK